jgi:hypothetical protein
MLECLRERPGPPALMLRCARCGVTRQIEDDGRRVHHAQVHASSCPDPPPGGPSEQELKLISSDRLEMQTPDGTVWFEISRTAEIPPARTPPSRF